MTHKAAGVVGMEDPSEWLGKVISGIDNAWYMMHNDVSGIFPILDGKMLNVNMMGLFHWFTGIDNFDGSHIVFIDCSRCILLEH